MSPGLRDVGCAGLRKGLCDDFVSDRKSESWKHRRAQVRIFTSGFRSWRAPCTELIPGVKSLSEVLEEVTEGAIALLEGVDHVDVTLARRIGPGRWLDNLESVAATGPISRRFDALQYQHGQGPCFDAIWFLTVSGSTMWCRSRGGRS